MTGLVSFCFSVCGSFIYMLQMAIYLVLFSVIWFFSIKTTAEAGEVTDELLSDDELVLTYGKDNVLPRSERSISEHVQEYRKSRSFATYQDVDGRLDDMTPVRSISVA